MDELEYTSFEGAFGTLNIPELTGTRLSAPDIDVPFGGALDDDLAYSAYQSGGPAGPAGPGSSWTEHSAPPVWAASAGQPGAWASGSSQLSSTGWSEAQPASRWSQGSQWNQWNQGSQGSQGSQDRWGGQGNGNSALSASMLDGIAGAPAGAGYFTSKEALAQMGGQAYSASSNYTEDSRLSCTNCRWVLDDKDWCCKNDCNDKSGPHYRQAYVCADPTDKTGRLTSMCETETECRSSEPPVNCSAAKLSELRQYTSARDPSCAVAQQQATRSPWQSQTQSPWQSQTQSPWQSQLATPSPWNAS